MKKLLVVLALISVFTMSVFAQDAKSHSYEKDESKWTDLSYKNVPVLKVLDAKEGYLVIYQKDHVGVGTTVIPKAWAKGNVDQPRKLKIRNVDTAIESYMSIVTEGGAFKRVVLNVPKSKNNRIWGVVENGTVLEGVDKATLEELDL